MSEKQQVCFESETEDSNTTPNMVQKVSLEKLEDDTKNSNPQGDSINRMWEKLVLYYLSRLKGLCDWRSFSRCYKYDVRGIEESADSVQSEESVSTNGLENEILQKVTKKARTQSSHENTSDLSDIDTFMVAGYEEGKQQAVKIVARSLKFGLLTGILRKIGSSYKIKPKYLCNQKGRKIVRKKIKAKQKYSQRYGRNSIDNKPIRRRVFRRRRQLKTSTKGEPYGCIRRYYGNNKKVKQAQYTPTHSSSESIIKKSSTNELPSAKRRQPRTVIKRPVIRRPPPKKRGRSQTKSPTPTRSNSKHSVTQYRPRKLRTNVRRYHMPRRNCSVISSCSSIISLCPTCRNKRKRSKSLSNDNENVKKIRESQT